MKLKLCWFTELAFLLNWITDECPSEDLTFKEIYDAAADGRFIPLLAERYGRIAEFGPLLKSSSVNLEQMEAALSEAAMALEGHEAEKVCVENSGLCLAMAIVVQAIQQQFDRPSPPASLPETPPKHTQRDTRPKIKSHCPPTKNPCADLR